MGSSGEPAARLASSTLPAADVPYSSSGNDLSLVSVDFERPALVGAGQKYALLASSQSGWVYGWAHFNNNFDSSSDIYPDGGGMVDVNGGWEPYPNLDFIFAAYVNKRPVVDEAIPAPGLTVASHRPSIASTVADAETELEEPDVSLFVDGRSLGRRAFVYDSGTDRLTYKPPRRLESGRHTVRVVAADGRGLTGSKRWSFKIG